MNFTLSASNNLPTGATVKVFTRATFPSVPLAPQGAPPGSGEAFSGTMGASSLTVTGLAADTAYVATTSVGGTDRYVQFRTAASVVGTTPTRTATLTAQAYTTVAADHDQMVAVTTGASNATVTLEDAATAGDGATVWVSKADTGAGVVSVVYGGVQVASLVSRYEAGLFRSDGSAWTALRAPSKPDAERTALRPSGVVWEAWPRTQSINAVITVATAKETVWAVWVPGGLTVTGMRFYANSTAATAPTHQFFTVRNFTTLALIKQTTDDTNTAWSASSSKSLSWLGGGSWVTTAGLYYFGFAFSGTTPPTLTGLGFNQALAAVAPIPVATTGDTISTGTAPDPAASVTSATVGRAYFELLG